VTWGLASFLSLSFNEISTNVRAFVRFLAIITVERGRRRHLLPTLCYASVPFQPIRQSHILIDSGEWLIPNSLGMAPNAKTIKLQEEHGRTKLLVIRFSKRVHGKMRNPVKLCYQCYQKASRLGSAINFLSSNISCLNTMSSSLLAFEQSKTSHQNVQIGCQIV
jgi:hypothetical protein